MTDASGPGGGTPTPERAIAFVVARLESERLHAKQLREIGGRTLLDWIVDHLEEAQELDRIVLTTVQEGESDRLRDLARRRGIECFAYGGDVDHVTTRLRAAAETFAADICVLVSADCPLVDGGGIDRLVRELRAHPEADIVGAEVPEGRASLLEGISVARLRCWQLADDLSYTPELRRHQFPVIRQKEHLFRVHVFPLPGELCGQQHRLSVDTWADLELMNALHGRLAERDEPFALRPAVRLLEQEPALREINGHVHQRKVGERQRKLLFVVDAGGAFGYGHLMRSREVALRTIEETGCNARFVVDDEHALELLDARGLRAHWGALGRAANEPPEGLAEELISDVAPRFDAVVVDVQAERTLPSGWRASLGERVVVLDRTDPWTAEADLCVLPTAIPDPELALPGVVPGSETRVVGGADYLILRRETRRARPLPLAERDLDLLGYLHDPAHREALLAFAAERGIRASVPSGPVDDFAERLARAKVLVSGFGVSFYEALALGAYPAAWPTSERHAREALRFYETFGLDPVLIDGPEALGMLEAVIATRPVELPVVEDGTDRVVQAILGESSFELAPLGRAHGATVP